MRIMISSTLAAEIAGGGAVDDADDDGDEAGEEADGERHAAGDQGAGQEVAAGIVGAEEEVVLSTVAESVIDSPSADFDSTCAFSKVLERSR